MVVFGMQHTSVLTLLALLGLTLACSGGSEDPAPAAPAAEAPVGATAADPPAAEPQEVGEPDAGAHMGTPETDPDTHYVNSSFGYCDAKVLAALWGESIDEAKTSIGRMLMNDERPLLEDKLNGSRERALESFSNRDIRCHYDEIGLGYEDAVALGTFWSIDPWEAKMRIEEKFLRDAHDDTHIKDTLAMAQAG